MSEPASLIEQHFVPTQVWERLAADLQARAIHLMAQLALNLVTTYSTAAFKEPTHVLPTDPPQDPN